MEVFGYRLAEPWWLLALALPLLLAGRTLWRERNGEGGAVLFPGASRLSARDGGLRARLRHLPLLAALLGLAAAVVALARPQQGFVKQTSTTQGVDIVVALDVSGSMAAEDFQPKNRLEVARQVVAEFVERRRRDRIGLVVFAGRSLTKAPPTTDAAVLLKQLEDVRLDMLPDGTAIGSGLATSLTRLRRSEARSKVVVLVTDGANNAGEIDPETATDLARAMEVRVYTVLVGKGGEVPMPVRLKDPLTGEILVQRRMVEVQIDPKLLETIASRTGGEFFAAGDPETLRRIFARIDALETSEIKQASFRRYEERYRPLLLASAALLLAAGLLFAGGLRVAPA
jgi:Ca-activated chloride channel family protein